MRQLKVILKLPEKLLKNCLNIVEMRSASSNFDILKAKPS